jgi:peptidoglycan/xylan/chitin deacetylase (PgdA/CDA1 family)
MARWDSILTAPALFPCAALPAPAGWEALAVLVWTASQAVAMSELLRPRSRMFGENLWRGASQPRVALTFDDGPHPVDTPAILEILDRARVRATFFFVGKRVRARPDLVHRAAAAGHEVGAHSDTHPWWFSLAPPARLRREVRGSVEALEAILGRPPRLFRPPMGHKNPFLARELQASRLTMATWSARAFDTVRRRPEAILRAVRARAAPGGIVLLHEGARRTPDRVSATVAALPVLIDELRGRGLEPVRVCDLIPAPTAPPAAGDGAPS